MSSCRFFANTFVFLFVAPVFTQTVLLAEEHRFVLSSATSATKLASFNLSDHVPDSILSKWKVSQRVLHGGMQEGVDLITLDNGCLLYTSPSPRDLSTSRMPSSA